jgi:hypothetical protein
MGEDQALPRLRDILARPEYQVDQSLPWWQQLLAPLWDLAAALVGRLVITILDAARGDDGVLGWGVLGLCLLILGLVAVYLVRAVRLSVLGEARVSSERLAERRQRSDQLWQTAQQLAAAGQLSDAIRLVYLSALYALDERALLHVETSLTNREHAQRLHSLHPMLGDTFGEVVEHYDRVRYGLAPVTPDAFADVAQRAERVRAAVFEGSVA